jgi:hypothetical protein
MGFESCSIHEPGNYAVQLATAQQNRAATLVQYDKCIVEASDGRIYKQV